MPREAHAPADNLEKVDYTKRPVALTRAQGPVIGMVTAISTSTDGHRSRAVGHRLCAGVHPPLLDMRAGVVFDEDYLADVRRNRHYFCPLSLIFSLIAAMSQPVS